MKGIDKIIVFSLLLSNPVLAADDWRFWNTDSVQGKLSDKLSAKVEAEFRFKDDMGKHYYTHADVSLGYNIFKWFDATLGYRQIYSLRGADWLDTNYSHINGTAKWNWANWQLSNRVRFAYAMPQEADDYWEFRNLFTVKSQWEITPLKLNPYISDEIFYNFNTKEWHENRAITGIQFPVFLENIIGKIYYMYNSKKDIDKWTNFNTLGTEINIKF